MADPEPLAGIRVLELARILAGPWAGQLLADLGAEVVKVERPTSGDDTRAWGPPFVETDGETASAYFHGCNRGKRSIAIDLDTPEGQAEVRALAAGSDVLIKNFKVGGLARYGLDYASVRGINERLVYCSVTGFGQTGPYAHRAGYDFMIQGMGGIMDLTGHPGGEPVKTGVAFADIFTGVYAVVGILAALRRRDVTGQGGHLDMSLLDTLVGVLANQGMNYLVSGVPPRRMGNAHPNIVPYQVFPASDGFLIIASGNDAQFRRLCAVLGEAPLGEDPRFSTNRDRLANREILVATLSGLTRGFTKSDLLETLERVGVPAGPINGLDDVFADPQVVARGMQAMLGHVPTIRSPLRLDGETMIAERVSPRLDQDGPEIRARLAADLVGPAR